MILLLEYLAFVLCIHFISYVMKQKKSKRYERQGYEIHLGFDIELCWGDSVFSLQSVDPI